jgi:hypothetical protein
VDLKMMTKHHDESDAEDDAGSETSEDFEDIT